MAELEIRLVRYFLAVAEQGSFTRAAELLHMSQPALSQAVRRLETLVGSRLLERGMLGSRAGVTLTTSGTQFLPAAEELVRAADRAFQTVRSAARPASLTVGFGTDTPRSLTRRLLRIIDSVAGLDLTLVHLQWGLERRALADGKVDLIFLQAPANLSDHSLRFVAVGSVRRVAVFPSWHRLASRNSITMPDLADEPILDAASNRSYWLVDPRPSGTAPNVVGPPTRTAEEMLALVSAGQGMAITSSSVGATSKSDELAFVPISDLEPGTIYLTARTGDRRAEVDFVLSRMAPRGSLPHEDDERRPSSSSAD